MENKDKKQKRRTDRNRRWYNTVTHSDWKILLEGGGLSSVLVSGVLFFTLLWDPSSECCCQLFQELLQEIFRGRGDCRLNQNLEYYNNLPGTVTSLKLLVLSLDGDPLSLLAAKYQRGVPPGGCLFFSLPPVRLGKLISNGLPTWKPLCSFL